jgi:hypothetical protein
MKLRTLLLFLLCLSPLTLPAAGEGGGSPYAGLTRDLGTDTKDPATRSADYARVQTQERTVPGVSCASPDEIAYGVEMSNNQVTVLCRQPQATEIECTCDCPGKPACPTAPSSCSLSRPLSWKTIGSSPGAPVCQEHASNYQGPASTPLARNTSFKTTGEISTASGRYYGRYEVYCSSSGSLQIITSKCDLLPE